MGFFRLTRIILPTKRLSLRDFIASDVAALRRYQTNPKYLEHYDVQPNAKKIIDAATIWAEEKPRRNYQLAICLKSSDEVIGSIGIRTANYPKGEAELGVEVDPAHWRSGFALESSAEILSFAMSIDIIKLHSITNVTNIRSQALLQKIGFTQDRERGNDAFYSMSLVHK